MRSPGVIYRKYRQIKRKYLYEAVSDAKKQCHENCVYGFILSYTDEDGKDQKLKLCDYGSINEKIKGNNIEAVYGLDVCTCPKECNAFVRKWNKKAVIETFKEELSDPAIKRNKYPELEAYEWILEKSLTEAKRNPSIFGKIIIFFIKLLEDLLIYVNGPRKKLG